MAKMKRKFGGWTVWDEAEHRADNFAKEWLGAVRETTVVWNETTAFNVLRHGFLNGFIHGFEHKFDNRYYDEGNDDDGNTL